MITANEVRCGNTLNYYTAEGDILPTTIDWQDLKWISEDEAGFNAVHSPIPITEEIIERLGFDFFDYESSDDDEFIYKDFKLQPIGKSFYYSCCDCGENGWQFCLNLTWSDQIHLSTVLYVHQLQNLYWCLCGKELSIEL